MVYTTMEMLQQREHQQQQLSLFQQGGVGMSLYSIINHVNRQAIKM